MFKLNTAEAKKFAKTLEKMGKSALGKATARTLTTMATMANAEQKKNLKARLIVRTPYTEKSLKMYPANESKPIERQNSVVGSVSPYLAGQDKGATVRPKGHRVAVPTNELRGPGRRKKIATRYRMNEIGDIVKSQKGRKFKGKFFIIKSSIYYRKSKNKLVRARGLTKRAYSYKGTHFHTDAIKKYAKTSTVSAIFARKAKLVLDELGAKS